MISLELYENPFGGGVSDDNGSYGGGTLWVYDYIPVRLQPKTGELWMSFINQPTKAPFKIGNVVPGQIVKIPLPEDAQIRLYLISHDVTGRKVAVDFTTAVIKDVNVNRELLEPTIAQTGTATNTSATIFVTGFSPNALFRKIEESETSDFAVISNSWIQDANNFSGILPATYEITTPSETSAKTRYYRVFHSSNNTNYGFPSNTLAITFADSGGSGGSVATAPTLGTISFDAGTDTVSAPITNNGGAGDIAVMRQLGSGDYVAIATGSVASMVSSGISDIPTTDGTYNYKLVQDGIAGSSEVRSIEVDVDEPGTGVILPEIYVMESYLNYVKIGIFTGGGTGGINFYKKRGSGGTYLYAGSVTYDAVFFEDTEFLLGSGNYTYKATQDGVAGESNKVPIFVETF